MCGYSTYIPGGNIKIFCYSNIFVLYLKLVLGLAIQLLLWSLYEFNCFTQMGYQLIIKPLIWSARDFDFKVSSS
jgi:hypothetical protein